MVRKSLFLFLVFFVAITYAQVDTDSTFVDTKYLEDQFYAGLTYNLLIDKPSGFNQNGISGGISVGYIRDFPINTRRNLAIGVGLGYAYNAYNQNLKITEDATYEVVSNDSFSSNRLTTYLIELPIEVRWRTSTATTYSFWRIYTGVKFGYVFASHSRYSDALEVIKVKNIEDLQKVQYGLTFSAGYSTFNLHLYYGLNTLFDNVKTVEGDLIDLRQLNVGMVFYIL